MDTAQKAPANPRLLRNAQMVFNDLTSRYAWINRMLDSRQNIDKECGHPLTIDITDYESAYQRGDVAARVVGIYPEETWSQDPEVFETEDETVTEFEAAWRDLNIEHSLLSHLLRLDILSGIGRFGIMLLGFDDGEDMATPLPEEGKFNLLYLRPLDETVVRVKEFERDIRNPRHGLPLSYDIKFSDMEVSSGASVNIVDQTVHHSRVVHAADNRVNSEVYGVPRMKRVYNRLLDLKKIAGGSAEMFWKGGFPGLSFQSHPNISEDIEFDKEETKEQMEAYMLGLQRYITSIGMDVKSLEVQVADPRPSVETQMRLIATTLAVPWRIFVGSESAHLASSQDEQTWNRRLTQRRRNYVNPYIIRPLVDKLIQVGALPKPARYDVWWPDLNTPSEQQVAENAERRANAISKYVQGGDALVPPFYFLTTVLGYEADEAAAIIKAAQKQVELLLDKIEPEEEEGALKGPARNGVLP